MDLRQIECDDMGLIDLAQDRDQCWALVNMVPENAGKFLSSCTSGGS
jgi:hypothetical protein